MNYSGCIPDFFSLYVFDLDGTLADSLADLAVSVNGLLGFCGLPALDHDEVRRCIGIGGRNLISRSMAQAARKAGAAGLVLPPAIAASGIASDPDPYTVFERIDRYPGFSLIIDDALPVYRTIYAENSTKNTRLYPGMADWLAELKKRGKKLAVLSNKADASSAIILRELGVDQYFDVIAGPDGTGAIKPDPAALRWVMHKTGFTCEHTIMIGDSMVDFAAARNAGTAFCGITGGLGEDADLRNAGCDYLIERS